MPTSASSVQRSRNGCRVSAVSRGCSAPTVNVRQLGVRVSRRFSIRVYDLHPFCPTAGAKRPSAPQQASSGKTPLRPRCCLTHHYNHGARLASSHVNGPAHGLRSREALIKFLRDTHFVRPRGSSFIINHRASFSSKETSSAIVIPALLHSRRSENILEY